MMPERFDHPIDPDRGWVVRNAQLAVVGPLPAGAEPEIQAPAAQPVERRSLASNDQRMPEVIGEHVWADAQVVRHGRRSGQGGGWGELAAEVIRHIERRVAELLGATGEGGPVVDII